MSKKQPETEGEFAAEVRHLSVKFEQVMPQNQLILEAVGAMQDQVKHIPKLRDDVGELKSDVKVVKAAVTDTNRDLHKLEGRVTKLEAARA